MVGVEGLEPRPSPCKRDKCNESRATKKSAPKKLKKEFNRLLDLIVTLLAKTTEVAPEKAAWKPPKEFLDCTRHYFGGQNPPYSWLRSKTCWQKHISDPYDSAFENWLYGWEIAAILTKTFPQHIETSTLPTLLKAYDTIKSCCVGEYVEHRLHITHVALAAPRWWFD